MHGVFENMAGVQNVSFKVRSGRKKAFKRAGRIVWHFSVFINSSVTSYSIIIGLDSSLIYESILEKLMRVEGSVARLFTRRNSSLRTGSHFDISISISISRHTAKQ